MTWCIAQCAEAKLLVHAAVVARRELEAAVAARVQPLAGHVLARVVAREQLQ